MPTNKPLLLQYANLKIQEKKIATELKLLHDQVEQEVSAVIGETDQQLALEELPRFSYSMVKTKAKWKYSPTVQAVIEDLAEMKKTEEQLGKATNLNDGKRELRFNQPKGE